MSLISWTPFGRGYTSFQKSRIEAAYDAFRDMITSGAKISDENFADNAGIPEYIFDFDLSESGQGHSHLDGSLGVATVGYTQLDDRGGHIEWPSGWPVGWLHPDRCEFVKAQSPGVVMIFGLSSGHPEREGTYEGEIYFGAGSKGRGAFRAGTIPVVLTTVYTGDETSISGTENNVIIRDVTSYGFTYTFVRTGTTAGTKIVYFWYCAIGTAPGYVSQISGVST